MSRNFIIRHACAFLILLALPCALSAQSKEKAQAQSLVFTNVTVIDATGASPKPEMMVVLTGNRIAALGHAGKVRVPKGAQVVDGTGKFLIPGLWDMHVHTASTNSTTRNPQIFFPLFIANGITGVRDMGGDLRALREWRALIESGAIVGPRILAAGPMLDGVIGAARQSISNEREARQAVDALKHEGADFIKVQQLLSRDAYFAIADEAKKQGLVFVGHVPDYVSAAEASDAGQKSIEHLTGILRSCSTEEETLLEGWPGIELLLDSYNEKKASALFARFVRNGTWQCPTLVWERGFYFIGDDHTRDARLKYMPIEWQEKIWQPFVRDALKSRTMEDAINGKRRFQKELEVVSAMRRAGVEFLAGTDTLAPYIFPGFSLHEELALFVKAGLTPMEALQTATRNPAKFLGQLDSLGTIEKGKLADLVLLDANPLDDIGNTQKIAAVIVGGRYFPKAALQEMLAQVEVAAREK